MNQKRLSIDLKQHFRLHLVELDCKDLIFMIRLTYRILFEQQKLKIHFLILYLLKMHFCGV
jgi:hypothetical protein